NHFLSNNNSIPRRSSSELHSSQDDQPITKLSNTVKGDYKFGMEKAKTVDKPEEQHVSPVKSGRGKGFMCYGDQIHMLSGDINSKVPQLKQEIAGEGSSDAHNKYYDSPDNDSEATLYSSSSDKTEESAN
ncbi:hypothetical protein Tco_1287075, partial [Tanacetum coccineum]